MTHLMHIQWVLLGCLASVSATNICCTSGCRLTPTLVANNNNALVVLGHETLDINSFDTGCGEVMYTVTINNGVTAIGSSTFSGIAVMTSIDASAAVITSIDDGAFSSCTGLQTVNFPYVTSIGGVAFGLCSALTTAQFYSVTSVGNNAFAVTPALTDLYIGTSGATIAPDAFTDSFLISTSCYNASILSNNYYNIINCTNGTHIDTDAPSQSPTANPTTVTATSVTATSVTATTITATSVTTTTVTATTVNASTAVSTTTGGGDSSPTTASSPQDTVVLVISLVVIGIIVGGVLYASNTPTKKSSTQTTPTQTLLDL